MSRLQLHLNFCNDESVTSLTSVLYLHPPAMASLSATNGSYMLVCTDKGQIVLKLNFHNGVQCAAFHSSIYKCYELSTIFVRPLQFKIDAAKEVYLYPEKFRQFMISSDFLVYITKMMRHIYIREHLKVNINYLGYSCYFTTRHITPNTPFEVNNKEYSPEAKGIWSPSRKDPERLARAGNKQSCQEKFYFLHLFSKITVKKSIPEKQISFKDIIALDEVIKFIKSSISSISQSDSLNMFPKGVLLIGPSGSGKSMISKALKRECSIPVFVVKCSGHKDNVEKVCEKAASCSASVVFLDDLDMIFTSHILEEFFISVVSKMLNYASNVLLIASVKTVNLIPPYLRRIGFFEKELYTNISFLGRKQIFLKILKEHKCMLRETEINEIIEGTNGFTGGLLQQLCNKAKESFLQDFPSESQDFSFTFKDLKSSLKLMKPTILFNFEIPNVKWNDIGGMKEVKDVLTEMINWPLRLSTQFKRFRITPSRGILMYGPPGCCKTMIAKALVTEGNFNFISVKASELFNKYVGESEKTVSDLFKRARSSSPCVLFFDEIDSLTSTRNSTNGSSNVTERILTQLLTEIDGIEPLIGVCILAATNRPDIIDPSFLRPGRFDHMIYIPLPDADTRYEIFNLNIRKMPSTTIDATYLVNATEGYSGAEISEICQMAAKFAIREDVASVSMKHFTQALREVLPKTSAEMKELFEKYEKQRSSHNY